MNELFTRENTLGMNEIRARRAGEIIANSSGPRLWLCMRNARQCREIWERERVYREIAAGICKRGKACFRPGREVYPIAREGINF